MVNHIVYALFFSIHMICERVFLYEVVQIIKRGTKKPDEQPGPMKLSCQFVREFFDEFLSLKSEKTGPKNRAKVPEG